MIDKVKYGVINLHPAALPFYRGCNCYAHAIMNNEKEYGVTLHYVDEGIDTGPIIDLAWLDIAKNDTGKSLYLKAQHLARSVFFDAMPRIVFHALNGNRVPARKQDDSLAKYYDRNSLSDKKADLTWQIQKLYDFVRALDFPPFEPAYAVVDGHKFYLRTYEENGTLLLNESLVLSGRAQCQQERIYGVS